MKRIEKMPIGMVNRLCEELNKRKRKNDSKGLIYIKDLYSAVAAVYGNYAPEEDIKATINALVCLGYLEYYKMYNGGKFYVLFTDVLRDSNNKVIGVRWTPKRWFER